jgi:hypothetical protein
MCASHIETLIPLWPHYPYVMCDLQPNCDGRFGQAGRCDDCGGLRGANNQRPRFSGGAGSRTHPLPDREYRRQMRKLIERAECGD